MVTYVWRFSEHRQTTVPQESAPLVPPGADAVLSVLASSVVILDASEHVIQASAPAMVLG
ncbi:MAG: two-component sensor histidine kinase, partial [Actinomycetales bacterium]